jgi:hypothetical protein
MRILKLKFCKRCAMAAIVIASSAFARRRCIGPAPAFTLTALTGNRALEPVQGPGRHGEFLGHLVRPVPAGDAAARPDVQEVQTGGLHPDRRQRRQGAPAVKELLARKPVSFPVLLDPANQVSKAYHVDEMPSSVIIDRKGEIRYIHRGYRPGDENEYQDRIRQLIRE